jgi:hypothetical protein
MAPWAPVIFKTKGILSGIVMAQNKCADLTIENNKARVNGIGR